MKFVTILKLFSLVISVLTFPTQACDLEQYFSGKQVSVEENTATSRVVFRGLRRTSPKVLTASNDVVDRAITANTIYFELINIYKGSEFLNVWDVQNFRKIAVTLFSRPVIECQYSGETPMEYIVFCDLVETELRAISVARWDEKTDQRIWAELDVVARSPELSKMFFFMSDNVRYLVISRSSRNMEHPVHMKSSVGTIFSLRSRRRDDSYLSLEVSGTDLKLIHVGTNGTDVVRIPTTLEDGKWHQITISIHDDSIVDTYIDCEWSRTDILKKDSFDIPEDSDLIIGYLFTGDLEQLSIVTDVSSVELQCSPLRIPIIDPSVKDGDGNESKKFTTERVPKLHPKKSVKHIINK
ncbi:concanavalin a-like lectin/glucanase domain superfamily [Holotrichia oblita]|uniref:Concanavalin a-like lectin/glucanase domain superfamily n=2 Tax=Holotrichia oblita TaxID=644536 RepID=A0ACB9SXJ4_HOLOL|nr:concanavalin a-like lectin/glucanase domain superfamily [Holotrichia oblita]KAI4459272.1 concanavalin a-like lectin/glucanase domain superfamily [Holotrichia oblita]